MRTAGRPRCPTGRCSPPARRSTSPPPSSTPTASWRARLRHATKASTSGCGVARRRPAALRSSCWRTTPPATRARWEPVVAGLEDLCPRVEVAAARPARVPRARARRATSAATTPWRGWSPTAPARPSASPRAPSPRCWRRAPVPASWRPAARPDFLAPLPVSSLLAAGLPDRARRRPRPPRPAHPRRRRRRSPPATSPAASVPTACTRTASHRGATTARRRTRSPDADLTARVELDPPAERVETAAFLARGLADELAARLDVRGLAVHAPADRAPRPSTASGSSGCGGATAPAVPRR